MIKRRHISKFLIEHFWGILISVISVLSMIFVLLFGIGPFVLLVMFGLLGFLIGDSIDRKVSFIESFKDFIRLLKRFLVGLVERKSENERI